MCKVVVLSSMVLIFFARGLLAASQGVSDNNISAQVVALEKRVEFQNYILHREVAALNVAIEKGDSTVYVDKNVWDSLTRTAFYGAFTGAFAWDALRRFGYISTREVVAPETLGDQIEKFIVEKELSTLLAFMEAGAATAWGFFFIHEAVDLGRDVAIHFRDTKEIKNYRGKLISAETNLEMAKDNLDVLKE